MEPPGSTPTDSTPPEAEHAPGTGPWMWRAPDHQAAKHRSIGAGVTPRFRSRARRHTNRVAPGSPPPLVSVPSATLSSKRECGPVAPPGRCRRRRPRRRGALRRAGVNNCAHPEGPETRAQRGARQPNESPSGDRSPNHARRTRRQGAAGAAGAAQKADHTSRGVYLASQARASGNPINSSSSAKSAISPATSRVVPCSFNALSVFWIDRMQPRISECG